MHLTCITHNAVSRQILGIEFCDIRRYELRIDVEILILNMKILTIFLLKVTPYLPVSLNNILQESCTIAQNTGRDKGKPN